MKSNTDARGQFSIELRSHSKWFHCSNKPLPSSLVPLFHGESKRETILIKMTLICMKLKLHAKLIFIWRVSHLNSFWNRGTRELGNRGLLTISFKTMTKDWILTNNITSWKNDSRWRLRTGLCKFVQNISTNIWRSGKRTDLKLGEVS